MSITEEEAALYDRQIRLWGLEAQTRLKNAKILVVGISPIASEIVKNLVLAGINTLTMADEKLVSDNDVSACFLFSKENIGEERSKCALDRVQVLNRMVKVNYEVKTSPEDLFEIYHDYDELIVCIDYHDGLFDTWARYCDKFTSKSGKHCNIHCVFSIGMHAFGFAYLGEHFFEQDKHQNHVSQPANSKLNSNGQTIKKISYPPIQDIQKLSWKDGSPTIKIPAKKICKGFFLYRILNELTGTLDSENLAALWTSVSIKLGVSENLLTRDDFLSCCGQPLVAVNAIAGGIIAQDIIQGLSHKGIPKGNWYFVDGRTCQANILWLPNIDVVN